MPNNEIAYEPNVAFSVLAGKAWRGAGDIANIPGVLSEAQTYIRTPAAERSASPDNSMLPSRPNGRTL